VGGAPAAAPLLFIDSSGNNDAADFAVGTAGDCGNAPIDPGKSCMVELFFAPQQSGLKMGLLDVVGSPGGMLSVGLTGNASVPTGGLTITPVNQDFGTAIVGGGVNLTMGKLFTVTNNAPSTYNLQIGVDGPAGVAPDFRRNPEIRGTCGSTL